MMRHLLAAGLVASACATACRADPGIPDYSGHVGLVDPMMETNMELLGPDPFVEGEDRLAVGLFYESGRSEDIVINGNTTNYFIFEGSYEQRTSSDRLEGQFSDEFTLTGTPFWGGGIIWNEAINLSSWTTLFVSLKSNSGSFETFDITLQSGDDAASIVLDPTAYGYLNDGAWHSLEIPLQDAIDLGFDPIKVRAPFIVGAAGGTLGDTLLVDNLYFTKD